MKKLKYFFACAFKLASRDGFCCPSCGSGDATVVSRKYVVTTLRRCSKCELLFRAPTSTTAENSAFYQETYREGFTTDTPTDDVLKALLQSSFAGHEKDYSTYIRVLSALGGQKGERLLDFGCSWGYGSWQLQQTGYDVTSYEISKPRCRYAREKLGLRAHDSIDEIPDRSFDIFFSAHVLEHVPAVSEVVSIARKKLKPGGLFVAFTPNGSSEHRAKRGRQWDHLWGMVHPNFLDARYYKNAFPNVLLASDPYDVDALRRCWCGVVGESVPRLDGAELMASVRMV